MNCPAHQQHTGTDSPETRKADAAAFERQQPRTPTRSVRANQASEEVACSCDLCACSPQTCYSRSRSWTLDNMQICSADGDARSNREQRSRFGTSVGRYLATRAAVDCAAGTYIPFDGERSVRPVLVLCLLSVSCSYSGCALAELAGLPCYRHPGTRRSATTSAICRASRGGTALPTCLYCSVRGPSKK